MGPNLTGDWTVIPLCFWEGPILYLMQALKARSVLGSSAISTRLKDSDKLVRETKGNSICQMFPTYNTLKLVYFIFVFPVF
jgi:hypothetical protein